MTVAAPSRWGGEPAGWTPAELQHRRRALHTLALPQRLVVQRPREDALLLARLAAHCEPAPAACLQAANGGNVTIGRHAPTISLLSSHPRADQAASSIAMPRSQGRANHNSSCLTSHGIEVSICGDAWSKQHRLTPQPREGPVLSADHVFFRHRLFDFR